MHAPQLIYEILRRFSLRISLPFASFSPPPLSHLSLFSYSLLFFLSIGLSSLQSAVIFSCRSYFRRAHPTSSPEAALHGLLSAHCLEAPHVRLPDRVTGFPGQQGNRKAIAERSLALSLFLASVANPVCIVSDIK